MKNILSLSCAPQRITHSKPPTLFFGGGAAIFTLPDLVLRAVRGLSITLLMLLAMLCLAPETAFGQHGGPGTAWTVGVNFQSNSPALEDTWAFDAVEMNNGDFVVVGYAETNDGATRVAAYAVIDKLGVLKHSVYYGASNERGGFNQVVKTPDGGCVMAGEQGTKGLLTKLDQNYNELWRKTFDLPDEVGTERIHSVDIIPGGNILLSGGFRFGSEPHGSIFFVTCDPNGNPIPNKTAVLSDLKGKILDSKVVTVGPETYVLATGYKIINEQDWKFEIEELGDDTDFNADDNPQVGQQRRIQDWDVMVGIFNVEDIEPSMDASVFSLYNSKDFDYESFGVDDAATGVNNNPEIWEAPSCAGVYGPCTPGRSAKDPGWGTSSENGSPVVDRYFGYEGMPRSSFVSKDVGRSIIYTNGYVYVAAEMNTFEMTGDSYTSFHRNGQNGVELLGLDCPNLEDQSHRYGAYKDAYVHLLRFKLEDGTNVPPLVKNVAHCSGGDFFATIVADQTDGKIVLGTTTADRGICNLPPIDECSDAEVHLLAKYDPVTLGLVWQQHYLANAQGLEGSCAFGLIQTADNGFLMIGNNEIDNPNGPGHDETFTIVKFNSDCQYGTVFPQDGDYTLTQNETWPLPNMPNPYLVRGNIIIPQGKQLVITGGLEVQFAYSKFSPGATKSGITVKPGGKLYVLGGAVLKGLECNGEEQMWDGITVEGLPNSGAGGTQGFMLMAGTATRIENAVRGVVLGGTGWETVETSKGVGPAKYTLLTNTYRDDLGKGGGKLSTSNGTFWNCGKGVVWNPMNGPTGQPASNGSALFQTKFEFTTALADPTYLPSNDGPGDPVASELGCQLRSVKDISFTNVSFTNTVADGLFPRRGNRPSGIYAVDSKLSVFGGTANPHYSKLYVGVESSSILGGAASTISITSKFDQVYQGVNMRGNVAPVISACQFNNIPNEINGDDGDPAGVHSVGTQGILLSANQFDSEANYDNYAARIDNSLGTGGAKVEYNQFTDMNVANLFENDNTSLQTHCNTYQGAVGDASWNVKGQLADQIDLNNPSNFPDNKFLWDCVDPILLDIQSTAFFSYRERVGQSQNNGSRLLCFTQPEVAKIPGNGFPPDPSCGGVVDPCPNPPYCNDRMGLYTSSGNSLPYRNDLLNAYVRMSPTAVADSLYLPGTTRAISLLASRNQQEDKRLLAATYASLGNYTTAQQYLQQVTGSGTETQDFIAYYTVLINAGLAGRDVYHLTALEFAQLAPLMTHNASVSENVKTLDHILNGVYHPLEAEEGTGGRSSGRSDENTTKDASISGFAVYPNPFSDEVNFIAPNGVFVTALTITEISGKVVFERNYASNEQYATWQANGIAEGILFYQCRISTGEVVHGKLIYSKKR